MGLMPPHPIGSPSALGGRHPQAQPCLSPSLAFASTEFRIAFVTSQPLLSLWPCTDRDSGSRGHSGQDLTGSQYLLPGHTVNSLQAVQEHPGEGCCEPAAPPSDPNMVQPLAWSHLNNSAIPEHLPQSALLQSVRPPAVRGPF